jgi:hypothetical protein
LENNSAKYVQAGSGPINTTDLRPFGTGQAIHPEGVRMVEIVPGGVGFIQTKAAREGRNKDTLLTFQLRAIGPDGFAGVEFDGDLQIFFPSEPLTIGSDEKLKTTYRLRDQKLFAALLSVGWTEAESLAILAKGIDYSNAESFFRGNQTGQGRMVILIEHDLDELGDKATNYTTIKMLKNGQKAHKLAHNFLCQPFASYQHLMTIHAPNKLAKSVVQQTLEQERAIGMRDAGAPAASTGNFDPAGTVPFQGAPAQAQFAQPHPGAVPGPGAVQFQQQAQFQPQYQQQPMAAQPQLPATPAGANPFPVVTAPGYAPVPNGSTLPGMPSAAPAPTGLGSILPPRV